MKHIKTLQHKYTNHLFQWLKTYVTLSTVIHNGSINAGVCPMCESQDLQLHVELLKNKLIFSPAHAFSHYTTCNTCGFEYATKQQCKLNKQYMLAINKRY